ncbi:hypothetical protein [Frigoribacterium sp. VKM Ac-2530]|uniref:hypothetical protein n=1 Tax=Frigoribacterium sp. VKM Ac-2530 TaxID=2783822 RepID=UPI00188CA708|nr:hypothetical protein [Frigoribacterium sp. VKM Ac-2530]MBF4578912.1 hypothetical protein [Frigoribacterium sp. VKM Ac-2530]
MDLRRTAATVAASVANAMTHTGVSIDTLSQGTDIPSPVLRDRLDNQSDFTWSELWSVGAFFGIRPDALMAGTA